MPSTASARNCQRNENKDGNNMTHCNCIAIAMVLIVIFKRRTAPNSGDLQNFQLLVTAVHFMQAPKEVKSFFLFRKSIFFFAKFRIRKKIGLIDCLFIFAYKKMGPKTT